MHRHAVSTSLTIGNHKAYIRTVSNEMVIRNTIGQADFSAPDSRGFFASKVLFNGQDGVVRKAARLACPRFSNILPALTAIRNAAGGLRISTRSKPMDEHALIPVFTGIIQNQSVQLCNARDLHAYLQISKDFSSWIKDRILQYEFNDGVDYLELSPELGKTTKDGHPSKNYHLTLDMAKELAMVENNEQGKVARRYFIELDRAQNLISRSSSPHRQEKISPSLKRQINRKAHDLSLTQHDTIHELISEMVEKSINNGASEHNCAAYIEQYGSSMGGVAVVNQYELYKLIRSISNLLNEAGDVLALIHKLEERTGLELYTRENGSSIPQSLVEDVLGKIKGEGNG